MTILCLSPHDDFVYWEAGMLAQFHGEKVLDYVLENLHHLSATKDTRLTILGHGNRMFFGDAKLTPKMLVADLVAAGLPTTIQIIDLAGCGIGETDEERKSFVREFTEELHKYPQYRHIQVNGFTNTVSAEPIAVVTLMSGLPGVPVKLYGLTETAKKIFDEKLAEQLGRDPLLALKNQVDALLEEKVANRAKIRDLQLKDLKNNTEEEKQEHHKRIAELQTLDAEIVTDLADAEKKFSTMRISVIEKLHNQLSYKFCEGTEMRRTLDYNANFHHSTEIFRELDRLDKSRKVSLQMVYTRIAELKEELFEAENSYHATRVITRLFSLSLPESKQDLTYQIEAFTKLAAIMKNPERPIEDVHFALADAMHDAKWNTKTNLQVAKKIMQALNVDEKKLEVVWKERKTLTL